MPTEEKFNVEDQLEGGTGPGQMWVPPPPSLHLNTDTHPDLEGYTVGDEFEIVVQARVTGFDESGNFTLEMSNIEIPPKPTVAMVAREEVEGPLGVMSNESLAGLLGE